MREVAIVGVGLSAWGEVWDQGPVALWTRAALAALADAGVDRVEALTVGCMSSGLLQGQADLGGLLADQLGVGPIPGTRVEVADASGAAALRQAILAVGAGAYDSVLATGVEKLTDVGSAAAQSALATATHQDTEGYQGATLAALFALMATAHMARYGTTRRQLSEVIAKNHAHGALNPAAQFQMRLSPERVESAPLVADPLTLLDCAPLSDGAAALLVVPLDQVKGRRAVRVAASAQASAPLALADRPDLTTLTATARAARLAYAAAGVGPADLALFELHDSHSIAEILATEALGLAAPGQGGPLVASGATRLGGRSPVNPSGGLKARGHAAGASGVAQVVEVVQQLRGEAGARQVPGARLGLAHSMAGTGSSAFVHIFEALSETGGSRS